MSVAFRLITGALCFVTASGPGVAEPCRTDVPKSAVGLGDFVSWERNFQPGHARNVPVENARYVRVLFQQRDQSDAAWTLRIRDGDGRPIQSITSTAVGAAPFWTRRLYADTIKIEVDSKSPTSPVQSLFYQVMPENPVPFYSTKSATPDWSDVYNHADGARGPVEEFEKRQAEAVGMFITAEGNNLDGVATWTCSGALVVDRPGLLFLTNDHCGGLSEPRWSSSVCQGNGIVDFSWDGDAISRQHQCLEVVKRSSSLDLALLRLAPAASDDAAPLPASFAMNIDEGEAIAVIHHPSSETKKISRNCVALIADVSGTVNEANDFAYDCDTEAGSSGAPVFDAEGNVVGIHHTGHEKAAAGQCDGLNKAVRLDRIREFLREAGVDP
ncbi:S1 family peptidase [Rhizobium laguerreae]|uniref:S1 family peptidase n=1 Tax=Rhizobium laguerreae TaxID=1076926 RepID=UPI001C90C8F3|nr:serine protease [Rhizobium laguerreae]MBY3136540.1 trypsin-like peptidase domain-containing protein [Rhizobium laguerreae]